MTIFLNAEDPYHLIFAGSGPAAIANRDFQNTILLGPNEGTLDRANPEVSIIDPLGTVPVTGDVDLWAIVDDTDAKGSVVQTAEVDVVPSAQGWSPAPSQIAAVIAPLAAAIATQIAQTGIPLIANPQQMYNITSSGSGGTSSALFGASIKPVTTVLAAEQTWQSTAVVGRNVKTMKIYQYQLAVGTTNDNWITTPNEPINACIALGARACLCYSPIFNTTTGAGTPTAKANMAASISALKAALVAGGAPPPVVTLWEEPQVAGNGFTGATYVAMVQYYANTDANGTGVRANAPLWYNGEGYHTDQAASFYPGSAFIDGIAVDYYGGDFFGTTTKSLDTWHQLDTTKPFGVWECGDNAGAGAPRRSQAQMQQFLIGPSPPGSPPAVLQELTAIIAAGGVVDSFMWYQNDGNTSGANYISSASDYRVPMLQQINDAITATAPSPGLSIGAGVTTTLTPTSPSTGGGYAPASGISYDVVINGFAGVGSTIPFMLVQLFWHNIDVPGSLSITRQNFFIPLGVSGSTGTVIQGQGPEAGILCAVKVKNLDTVTGFINFQMASVSRQQNAHRWYWNAASSVAVPSFLAPDGVTTVALVGKGSIENKVIAAINPNVTAGSKVALMTSMWTGNAWIRIQNAGTFDVLVQEPQGDQVIVWHGTSSSTAELDVTFPLPRSPVLIILTNNGATGSLVVDMIAQDP